MAVFKHAGVRLTLQLQAGESEFVLAKLQGGRVRWEKEFAPRDKSLLCRLGKWDGSASWRARGGRVERRGKMKLQATGRNELVWGQGFCPGHPLTFTCKGSKRLLGRAGCNGGG